MNTDKIIQKHLGIKPEKKSLHIIKTPHGRIDLLKTMALLDFKIGAEIGVNRGRHSKAMCKNIPGLKLFAVDPWIAYPVRNNQARQDRCFNEAKTVLAPHDVKIIKQSSMEAVQKFKDKSLDFVYIDGDHSFDAAMLDLIMWSAKVKIGGIVAGHDYAPHFADRVVTAVDAYVKAHNINPWYLINEKWPTFFWVRKNND